MEIETLATKHACEPTSTAETKDVSIQTESCDTGDEQASVIGTVVAGGLGEEVKLIPDRMLGLATATDEDKDIHAHAWNGTTEGTVVAGVSISTKQEAPSAASLSPAAAFRAQRCAGAEGCDIESNVCSATGAIFDVININDGNRRFGRDAPGVTVPVTINHGVTDGEDAGAVKSWNLHANRQCLGKRRF